jgi:hypothetical protein
MRSWTLPEPPPPRRSRFLWLALLSWIAAIALSFRWVWPEGTSPFENTGSSALETLAETPPPRANAETAPRSLAASPSPSSAIDVASEKPNRRAPSDETEPGSAQSPRATAPRTPAELPGCETFLGEAKAAGYGRLPTHIGLSALDSFVGSTQWTKHCRGRKRRSVELCAAIRDGSLVGLTLQAKPVDLTLEECLREAALKLTFRSEPELRIYRAELNL